MKSKLFFLVFLSMSAIVIAQVKFEKGYFINSQNQKTECYIKNEDWANGPSYINYRISEDGEIKKMNSSEILELGIYNFSKFKRFEIKIYEENLSNHNGRDFKYTTDTVLLNALLDGDVTLYEYKGKSFFIQKKNEDLVQLVSLRYVNKENKIKKYAPFRRDLSKLLKCDAITLSDLEKIRYTKKNLVAIVKKYNTCMSNTTVEFASSSKATKMNINLRAGLDFSSFNVGIDGIGLDETLDSSIGYLIGVEFEFMLPFNKGKWSLLLEPSYRAYSASKKDASFSQTIDVTSNQLLLAFGLRHYMFLNNTSSLYVTGNYSLTLNSNRSIDFSTFNDISQFRNQNMISLSFGFNHSKKYYAEIKYNIETKLVPDVVSVAGYELNHGGFNLIFGYRLF